MRPMDMLFPELELICYHSSPWTVFWMQFQLVYVVLVSLQWGLET
jgi:hypothetical protein